MMKKWPFSPSNSIREGARTDAQRAFRPMAPHRNNASQGDVKLQVGDTLQGGRDEMGKWAILAVAIAAAVSLAPRGAEAERYYPWCAYYDEWASNCGFMTRAQCLATVSGAGGVCRPNPYAPPLADNPRPRRRY
jgi:hypothetical protein